MDPKSSSPLDPKLQEAYNKVMGTQIPSPAPSDTTPLATPPQTSPDIPTPSMPSTPISSQIPSDTTMPSSAPAEVTSAQPLPTPEEPAAPVATPAVQATVSVGNAPTMSYDNATPTQGFSADKKKMKISPVIIIIGGIVFLIVYSIVWIKVFNLQVPYINP